MNQKVSALSYFKACLLHCLFCSGVNLAGLLSVSTKEEQHAVTGFLCAEGIPGTEIHCRFQRNMETLFYCSKVHTNG
jgi:hypothetical protein